MKIYIGADHRGANLAHQIYDQLKQENKEVEYTSIPTTQTDDYPDFAKSANQKVIEDDRNVGIYICGTGIGMSIVANRNPKIRAALCMNEQFASLARRHNDANVLCLPGRFMNKRKAIKIVKVFLTTDFEGGRHARRIKKY